MSHTVSVVIPIFNMVEFVHPLWRSLKDSTVVDTAQEVIFVDDGSTDGTANALKDLAASDPVHGKKLRVIALNGNQGRFIARLSGARQAKTDTLFFVDARVELTREFGERLRELLKTHQFIQPQPRIDISRSVFCLYWDRSHRVLFRRHFRDLARGPLNLTIENYDLYLKGTTTLVVPRELFIKACERFGDAKILSDDTLVMKEMVRVTPLLLEPSLWHYWVPREEVGQFLWRLYDRGPGLVEYHVFTRRGWIFYAIAGGLIALCGWLGSLIFAPQAAAWLALVSLGLLILSTAAFARSPKEFLRLAPLHVAVIFAVGCGVLKGLVYNSKRWIKGELSFTQASV